MCYLNNSAIQNAPGFALYAFVFSGNRSKPFSSDQLYDELEQKGSWDISKSTIEQRLSLWLEEGLLNRSAEGQGKYEIA